MEKVFSNLRVANVARQADWCPDQKPDLSFRGNELAGETGEVCNVIKKLERERQGWRGSRDTVEHLGEELADVVICADLVAIAAGIDLSVAVADKFNETSIKVGLPHRLELPVSDGEALYRAYRKDAEAKWPEDYAPGTLAETLVMLDRHTDDVFPASADGKIAYARAIMQATAESIRAHLASAGAAS